MSRHAPPSSHADICQVCLSNRKVGHLRVGRGCHLCGGDGIPSCLPKLPFMWRRRHPIVFTKVAIYVAEMASYRVHQSCHLSGGYGIPSCLPKLSFIWWIKIGLFLLPPVFPPFTKLIFLFWCILVMLATFFPTNTGELDS